MRSAVLVVGLLASNRLPDGVLEACVEASRTLAIDRQCSGVFVSEVEECFLTGDLDICAEAGGCMFDALDEVCPPPL